MIQTKAIYQKVCNSGVGHELTKAELKSLQNHLIKMYRDIESVCKKHDIKTCLGFGNVLGAVRHNGWIPWDDDLDIHMMRDDYEKFLSIYSKELPEKYHVSSYLTKEGSFARFAKIIDTSTVFVPLTGNKSDITGCFIDIFPIDNVPVQPIRNKARRLWSFFLMYTAGSVMQFEENSKKYKDLMFSTKEGRNNWLFRQIWGRIFSFFSYKKWNRFVEKYGKNKKKTGFVHVMAILKSCYKPVREDVFYPFKEIDLPEIGHINIPNDPEQYLSIYYGDWKKIPDDSGKWHHYVSEFEIPDSIN